MQRSKQQLYSITSSARPSKGRGIVRPSVLAVFRDLLDRQVSRFLSLKDAASVNANLTERVRKVRSVRHETPGENKLTVRVYGRHCVTGRQFDHQIMLGQKEILTAYHECAH